jgi:hypothetical protein
MSIASVAAACHSLCGVGAAGDFVYLRGADALEELYLLEHIARVARERQQWELAEHTAQIMLDFDPNYFGAHYAAALVAEHNDNAAKAHQELAAARQLWSCADPGLPELSQIDSKLPRTPK